MNARPVLCLLAFGALASGAAAQTSPADPSELASGGSDYFRVQRELGAWQARHGDSWRVVHDAETGHARFLYGGRTAALFAPAKDSDYFVLARHALAESQPLHGIDPGTLVEERVTFLPLANAGTTDKMTVNFRQEVGGVPVLDGFASVLFDLQGRVLSIDTTGLPGLAGFSAEPGIDAGAALDAALALFAADTGLPPTSVGTPELLIDQVLEGKLRQPRLVWQVEVHFSGADVAPEGYFYRIDAKRGGLVQRRDAVHYFDVSGTVRSMATPGAAPDTAGNPEVSTPMPHLRVNSAQGNAVTDSNGNFTIVGATAPLSVTVSYDGTFAATNNTATTDYSLTTTLSSSSGNSVLMNPTSATLTTAEANGFNWIGKMRDWTRAINPADPTSDFLATSNVNISSTCNAYFDGVSVNFYQAGGGCVNTAYSSVVLHEMGHWLNVKYGSGNGSDGFGEGNADNFSTHILDDPIVGQDFCGTGCHVRNANNNRQFCGDCCGGCYGGVHADGEVLMGALWKVRNNLKTKLGQAAGRLASDTLFNAWLNAYNDTQIKTIIEIHYLELDDNDGNINNGTPNYSEIDAGFKQQGFPGYALSFVTFANVTALPNTTNETGPYIVSADISATFTPPVVNPTLHYRVDGGAYTAVPMSPGGGSLYGAPIPGQSAPAKVEYYLSASDSGGQGGVYPEGGAASPLKFYVGIITSWFKDDFESGTNGWTHGQIATQDDWHISSQFGVTASFGQSGDPTTAPSGTSIWGNDLGPSGWNGAYQNNVNNWLRSPTFSLVGATGSTLTLKRWLTVERSTFDQARIRVNGTTVWTNPAANDLLDTSWQDMEIDISAIADNNPSVQIEFSLQSDGGTVFGGWNIDDVEVLTLGSSCPAPLTYCTAKVTSALTIPLVGFTGTPSASAGNFVVTLSGAIGNTNGLVFWGDQPASTPFIGGTLCVGPPTTRGPLTVTSPGGAASFPVTITAQMIGKDRYYQWWFRDVADPFTAGLSNGLHVRFCD